MTAHPAIAQFARHCAAAGLTRRQANFLFDAAYLAMALHNHRTIKAAAEHAGIERRNFYRLTCRRVEEKENGE